MIHVIVAAALLAQVQVETQDDPRCARGGSAMLQCVVAPDGRPQDCQVLRETPARCGFGQAALDSMVDARFAPSTVNDVAQGGRARFTVRFQRQPQARIDVTDPVDDTAALDQSPPDR
jgi:TonB family protein